MGLFLWSFGIVAQTVNWKRLGTDNTHLLNANAGLEYGLIYGVGYGYYIDAVRPIILSFEYSAPSGITLLDDLKTKAGMKIKLLEINSFVVSANMYGLYRRYENDFVRLGNVGSDISAIAGFYKSKWFVAAEFGFDKAIVTNFKHSDLYRSYFPQVNDGWYQPSTGGNIYCVAQAGLSFGNHDVYLKAGSVFSQSLKPSPSLPFIVNLGYNFRISN